MRSLTCSIITLFLSQTSAKPSPTVPISATGTNPPSGPLPDPPQCLNENDASCLASKLHCTNDTQYNTRYVPYGNTFCFHSNINDDDTSYLQPLLKPLQIAPILNRNSEIVHQHSLSIELPPTLIDTLINYIDSFGILDLFRGYALHPLEEKYEQFLSVDTHQWFGRRMGSDLMHQVVPCNEMAYEETLETLFRGGLSDVLSSIGEALKLEGLALYHFSLLGGSSGDEVMRDADDVRGGFKLIFPLLLEQDAEMIIMSDKNVKGTYKLHVGGGVILGSVKHGWSSFDYTAMNGKHGAVVDGERLGMRVFATFYIADINDENVWGLAETMSFPFDNVDWLKSQAGRHWRRNDEMIPFRDGGRKAFRFRDELEDCPARKKDGLCEKDEFGTRRMCLKTCEVYIEQGPVSVSKLDDQHVEVCTQNRTGSRHCQSYQDSHQNPGQFVTPDLKPGEMFPIVWRDTHTIATQYAFQIGFPPELISSLLSYCDKLGITNLFRDLVGPNPIPAEDEHSGKFVELADGNKWYVQRPAKKWTSNMHWVSPADEKTHEEYLQVLAGGNFDLVLDAIGRYLGLQGLVAYHLTFIGVSHSEKGFMHHDSTRTGASVYNVIIPLILDDDALPELVMTDNDDEGKAGALKYKIGMGALMGDDAMHGTEACDYRPKNGMRLAATVYIADINYNNAWDITSQTLTQIFPLPDTRWLLTQEGRHWGDDNTNSLVADKGRKKFLFHDALRDCADRAAKGLCEYGRTTEEAKQTRQKCMKSCRIYEESLNAKLDGDDSKDELVSTLDSFYNSIGHDPSCTDENENCAELASKGLCMKDPEGLKAHGCNFSCLFCLTTDSKHVHLLGEEQTFTEEEREQEDLPSQAEISAAIAESEEYLTNEVLLYEEYDHVRLACRNFLRECSLWAAEGECDKESEFGWMRKNCPLACKDCLGIDPQNRCPIDYESNAIGPNDINKMFERWLEEAGQDVSAFSPSNLPLGGSHPFGEIIVITSPYHDMMTLLKEEDKPFANQYSPVPWVVGIENFLSDEECQRLIDLGGDKYERSTEVASDMNIDGSYNFVESEGRTSTNTWCQDECWDDPMAKAVIERITNMTGIPYDNYEDLQLVRYMPGQFYQKHHDEPEHKDTPSGPRILTFFLYLNDVEDGGGTAFEELKFAVQPKKGMALVWPSVLNENPDEMDDWTWHEALPVKSGIKYGANAWIHLRNYQNVPDYC